jgi:hypothetical protein
MAKPASRKLVLRDLLRKVSRLALEIVKRTYAVGVIVLVTWLSYRALEYLVVTLVFPTPTPAQIVGIPTRLNEAVLQTRRSSWLGVQISENPRTPLAHYHRLDSWIQPDRFNDCTRNGCHAPLPHAQRKEVRAFLNMHATSLHCGVCHIQSEHRPLVTTWYDLHTGAPRGAPTVLRIYAWLVSDEGRSELAQPTADSQDRLVELLRTAAREADGEPALTQLAEHFAAVRYSSPAFQQLVEEASAALPRHFRGEYGAKLALRDGQGRPILGAPGTEQAIQAYLAEAQTADPARRALLLGAVHPLRRTQPVNCADCHRSVGGLVDFAAAGYPPARVEMLSQPVIFRLIESIAAGQPFYLPTFVSPEEPPPEAPPGEPREP